MNAIITGTDSFLNTLDEVVKVIDASAREVDETAAFSRRSIDALSEAGLLGLVSAEEVGGMGGGIRAGTLAVERISRA